MPPNEFDLIDRYFAQLAPSINAGRSTVDLGVGDDCALMSIADDQQLAVSIDTLNADVHFPADANASLIAQRALAVSISDLAAMGATPLAFTLAISMPSINEAWLDDFSRGLKLAAEQYHIALIGGDTTRGPLSLTLQVQGTVPKGYAIRRSGAQVGDLIYVTGSLGDAAAALANMQGALNVSQTAQRYFQLRYYQPRARIEVGESLHDVASAAIDISDGLAADLGHILRASGVAAELHSAKLPLSNALLKACSQERAQLFALTGGDDYELCFTASPDKRDQVAELAEFLEVQVTEVGRVVMGEGLRCLDLSGATIELSRSGYQHFSDS